MENHCIRLVYLPYITTRLVLRISSRPGRNSKVAVTLVLMYTRLNGHSTIAKDVDNSDSRVEQRQGAFGTRLYLIVSGTGADDRESNEALPATPNPIHD